VCGICAVYNRDGAPVDRELCRDDGQPLIADPTTRSWYADDTDRPGIAG
jgi:hypothetical protein